MKTVSRCLGVILLSLSLMAGASDSGKLLRASELRDKPFTDAAVVMQLPANTPIVVLKRQGSWAQVEARGKQGWIRVLNIVTQSAQKASSGMVEASRVLTTGSSGRESSTAVKGVTEESLKKARPAPAEVNYLETLGSSDAEARAFARDARLKSSEIPFLSETETEKRP